MFDVGHRDMHNPVSANDEDDKDASASVADTDVTDMSGASELTSQGSLTSVD